MRREIPGPKSFISYLRFKQNGNCDNPGFLERYWREKLWGGGGGRGARGGVGMRGGRGGRRGRARLHIIFLTNFI